MAHRSKTRKRGGDPSGPLYDIGAVAHALGEPMPLLKSWCEQGILTPVADAQGTGTRRRFDHASAVKAGILVELRRLLGTHFRPGEIAREVSSWDRRSPEWAFLDRAADATPVFLVFYRERAALALAFMGVDGLAHVAKRHAGLIALNVTAIHARLQDALSA